MQQLESTMLNKPAGQDAERRSPLGMRLLRAAAHLGLAGQDVQRLSILLCPMQQRLPVRLRLCYLLCLPRPLQAVWGRALRGCNNAANAGLGWNVCDAINTSCALTCAA